MNEFQTSVSEVNDGIVNLRGFSLEEIMTKLSFTEGAYLAIFGRLPSSEERQILDVVLNSLLDHGFVASTITAARYIASGNPQLVPAVAGGLLACGSNTVSPEHSVAVIERAIRLREDRNLSYTEAAEVVVDEVLSAGRRMPGLGHPTHKTSDFRADVLFATARKLGLAGVGVEQFSAIHQVFLAKSNRVLPINIDGALAALGVDLAWSAQQIVAVAMLSVLPGLLGHVIEEIGQGKPLRHITNGSYTGQPLGPLPTTL
jgi:citrate synthase